MNALQRSGELNSNYRGGRKNHHGYVLVLVGREHPMSDKKGYAYEHRLVLSESLGRPLGRGEEVHHKDGNKANNVLSNLEGPLTKGEHSRLTRLNHYHPKKK